MNSESMIISLQHALNVEHMQRECSESVMLLAQGCMNIKSLTTSKIQLRDAKLSYSLRLRGSNEK